MADWDDVGEPSTLPQAPPPKPAARDVAPVFLELLSQGYSPSSAARALGIGRTAMYHLRDAWPEFAAAWKVHYDRAIDVLEDAAIERAVRGIPRRQFYQGVAIEGSEYREYSDTLLLALLKARAPERYRERYDVNQHVDVVIDHAAEILEARRRAGATIIDATPTSVAHEPSRQPIDDEGGADVSVRRKSPES